MFHRACVDDNRLLSATLVARSDCVGLRFAFTIFNTILRPCQCSGITCNIVIGFIANRVATHWILSTGAFATGISLILFATMPVGATYWTFMFFATVSMVVTIERYDR